MSILTTEQRKQFSEILEELGKTLDISKEQHDAAVRSYEYVAGWLAAEDSPLYRYKPEIIPQGSFMLGTMTKPIHEDDELDIDLVCRLEGKRPEWTQFDVKRIVGERLASNGILKKLLKIPDGRRCWTLQYAESAKFHLDVLPSIVSSGYRIILEKALSAAGTKDVDSLAIRITCKDETNYRTSTRPEEWPVSNPFGYGIWFEQKAAISFQKSVLMSEAVQAVPRYSKDRLPLQRAVQILKRHRDLIFNGDDDKPISIIITTLAARSYRQELSISDALTNIILQMPNEIEERYSAKHGRMIKWIANPVNDQENFADKWADTPKKQENFYKWLTQVQKDVLAAQGQRGLHAIQEAMKKPFGEREITKAFANYGDHLLKLREGGSLKMASVSGALGTIGSTIKNHNFHGR